MNDKYYFLFKFVLITSLFQIDFSCSQVFKYFHPVNWKHPGITLVLVGIRMRQDLLFSKNLIGHGKNVSFNE